MEIDKDAVAPDEDAKGKVAAPTTPKRRRHRQKKKQAAPAGPLLPDFDAREVIEFRQEEEERRREEQIQTLLDAGFPLHA